MSTIVIGAGFAGLTAAIRLVEEGVDDVVVVEARERVGGRTKLGQIAGVDIDLGGMWMGPTQTRLEAYASRFGVTSYPTYLDGKAVFRIAGVEHLGEREDLTGCFSEDDLADYLRLVEEVEKLALPLDLERPWEHPDAATLDAQTFDHWMRTTVESEAVISTFRLMCLSLFCAEASQVSMLFFAHYVKSGDGLDSMMSADTHGAQASLFDGGLHQIAAAMASSLGPRLRLGEPVTDLRWTDESVEVVTTQGEYQARNAIVAVPPTLLPRIRFRPHLPQARQRLNQRLEMGSAIKYWVAYDRPFWRDLGLNGTIFRDDVPCAPALDVTPPGADRGLIAGFFDANHAVRNADIGTDERCRIVTETLAEHFGAAALEPLEYLDVDWSATEWSNGCYGNFAPPGVYADFAQWLRRPLGAIHWAGTETSPYWTGYVEGAIRSGESAADVIAQLAP